MQECYPTLVVQRQGWKKADAGDRLVWTGDRLAGHRFVGS